MIVNSLSTFKCQLYNIHYDKFVHQFISIFCYLDYDIDLLATSTIFIEDNSYAVLTIEVSKYH